jgi:hypothetical protein
MYRDGKLRPAETALEMRERGIKESEFNYDIL